ncbi:MAG: hypothetical protein GX975_06925 [Clostridiales bacterium]|nr:hypothetical protein [Clostridiales bacterium]
MKKSGKALLLTLAIILAFSLMLSGCGKEEPSDFAKTHVQGLLDGMYKGQYNKDLGEVSDVTKEDIEDMYELNIELEAEWFVDYFELADLFEVGEVSEESMDSIEEFYKKVYAKAKYEVHSSVKQDGNYLIDVDVYPIDIIERFHEEDSDKLFDDFLARIEAGEFDELSDEEVNDEFIKSMLEMLEARIEKIGYSDKETVTFTMVKDPDDGLYFVEDELMADAYIITY